MLDDRTQSSLLLTEAAYRDRALPALRLARTSRTVRLTGRALLVGLAAAFTAMFFAPWQQTVAGSGTVVAYDPAGRQQPVQARIEGLIVRRAENLRENDYVEEGQFIMELADVDAGLLSRLEGQLEQQRGIVRQAELGRDAAAMGVRASENAVANLESNVKFLQESLDDTLAFYEQSIAQSQQKVEQELQTIEGAKATLFQAEQEYRRQFSLYRDGIASEQKLQEVEQKFRKAEADLAKHQAKLEDAKLAVGAKRSERDAKRGELMGKLDEARGKVEKGKADVQKAEADLQKAEQEVNKARKELADAESKLAKQQGQVVVAPVSGYVTNLISGNDNAIIKKGETLFTLVPDTDDRAVQIWLDGNDAPLVSPGRHVRLQFEGWPAVQTPGYPSVAVGTFGGEVATIDAFGDGAGDVRVLILPDTEDDMPWPEPRFLRQGVRANGFVLLEEVTLGYELWRRLNGFPPVLDEPPGYGTGKDGKAGGGGKSDKGPPKPVKMRKQK